MKYAYFHLIKCAYFEVIKYAYFNMMICAYFMSYFYQEMCNCVMKYAYLCYEIGNF